MDKNNKIFIAASLANGASFSMILPLLASLVRQLKLSELQGGAMVSGRALLIAIAAIYISKNQNKFSIYQLLSLGFIGMTITWGIFTAVLLYGLSVQVSLIQPVWFAYGSACRNWGYLWPCRKLRYKPM